MEGKENVPHPLEDVNIRHEDFVGIYEELISPEACEKIIDMYQDMTAMPSHYLKWDEGGHKDEEGKRKPFNRSQQTGGNDLIIKDLAMGMDEIVYGLEAFHNSMELFHGDNGNGVMQKIFAAFSDWCTKYSIPPSSRWSSLHWKFQETRPLDGSGYHVWHTEHAPGVLDRFGVWMLYLNDVEVAGETEFLYYGKRIQPKAGTLLVWPAGVTHVHRGNPPVSNTKYVLTGWLQYLTG